MKILMECQKVFIKIRSHRPPGVQINVVYQQIQLSSSTQQAGCWIHSEHFTRIVLDARNSSEKLRLLYECISSEAGLLCRSDLEKSLKLKTCILQIVNDMLNRGCRLVL